MTYPETITVDVDNDLERELALCVQPQTFRPNSLTDHPDRISYKQALACAQTAHTLATQHTLPFTRPADFFAEMVKSDAHMERIRQRLLDETAGIKRSEDKRKQREGKKFGKQVQIEKLKERERSKKEMDDRLKGLKRSKFALHGVRHTFIDARCCQNEKMRSTSHKTTTASTLRSRMPSQIVPRSAAGVVQAAPPGPANPLVKPGTKSMDSANQQPTTKAAKAAKAAARNDSESRDE